MPAPIYAHGACSGAVALWYNPAKPAFWKQIPLPLTNCQNPCHRCLWIKSGRKVKSWRSRHPLQQGWTSGSAVPWRNPLPKQTSKFPRPSCPAWQKKAPKQLSDLHLGMSRILPDSGKEWLDHMARWNEARLCKTTENQGRVFWICARCLMRNGFEMWFTFLADFGRMLKLNGQKLQNS